MVEMETWLVLACGVCVDISMCGLVWKVFCYCLHVNMVVHGSQIERKWCKHEEVHEGVCEKNSENKLGGDHLIIRSTALPKKWGTS